MDDEAAADQVPPTPEDDQEPRDDQDEIGEAQRRVRRWGTPTWQSAGDCCAEAACEGACGMLSAYALFHVARVAVTDVRRGSRPAGQSRSERLATAAIRAYQRDISPARPPCCRFTPTCSAYAAEAVSRQGAIRGTLRTVARLRRCGARGRRRLPIAPDPVR